MNYKLAKTVDEIQNYIRNHNLMALDIETSPMQKYRNDAKASLDSNKSEITGISLSIENGTGIYIPLRHRNYDNADFNEVFPYIKQNILLDENKTVVIHNAVFESSFFYALGVVMKCKVYDTMAAAQLTLKTNTEFRSLADSSLKKLVPELLKVNLPTFDEVVSQAKRPRASDSLEYEVGAGSACFDELNPENFETIRYACVDSDYALRLYHVFNKWFDQNLPKHRFIVEEIESPTAVYVGLMKHNGLLVDRNLLGQKQSEATDMLRELKEAISILTGNVDIGSNATTQEFKNFLYGRLGLPVLKTTGKNKEAADDEAFILLSSYCKEHEPEYVPLFDIIKEYRKWGKIKSTYIDSYLKHLNSATGRIHPDLFPLGTETGRFARGLLRSLKFKAGLNKTLEECEEIIKNLKAGYPQLETWQRKVKVKAKFNEYTETYLGRRRYLPNILSTNWNKKSFSERQALNTPIQGTAADILKLSIVRILRGLPERPWLKPLLQIHDELIFELPKENLNEAVEFVKRCMETQPFEGLDIPLVAEAAVETRFGSLKEMED